MHPLPAVLQGQAGGRAGLTERIPSGRTGRRTAEAGVAVALSLVLGLVPLWTMPNGGQISLDMVPILLLARLRGVRVGVLAGVAFGLLHMIQEPVLLHPGQVLLDYPLPYGALGLAGLFPKGAVGDVLGTVTALAARYALHVLSGVLFLHLFLPAAEMPVSPLVYSLLYNAAYLVPSGAAALLLVPLLRRRLAPWPPRGTPPPTSKPPS